MVQGTDYAYTHIYTSDTDIHRIKENKKLVNQNAQTLGVITNNLENARTIKKTHLENQQEDRGLGTLRAPRVPPLSFSWLSKGCS